MESYEFIDAWLTCYDEAHTDQSDLKIVTLLIAHGEILVYKTPKRELILLERVILPNNNSRN